jgi:uncharacterized membrane protein
MFTLPSPLHPAIVHFPIVLVLLGAAAAVAGCGLYRWNLPWIAAVLLTMGSIGAFVAAQTGEDAEDQAGNLSAAADALLEKHEEAAERTEFSSAAAAILAIAAAGAGTFASRRKSREITDASAVAATPGARRSPGKAVLMLRAVAALASLTACWFVYQTGRAGGELVYDHGVGVKQLQSPDSSGGADR